MSITDEIVRHEAQARVHVWTIEINSLRRIRKELLNTVEMIEVRIEHLERNITLERASVPQSKG